MMHEVDPNGLSPHAKGAKLDKGKPRPNMVFSAFSRALLAVARVGTFGADKYTDDGWLYVDKAETRYADAGFRHYLYRWAGEEVDPESEELHLAHEVWNKLAELELCLRRLENGATGTECSSKESEGL